MWRVILSATLRQKLYATVLICTLAIGAGAAVVMDGFIERQETALLETRHNTTISCVLTDIKGMNQEHLGMPSGIVERMLGNRQEQGYHWDELVKNVRAKGSMPLIVPEEMVACPILSLDSDPALSPENGCTVTFYEGWDESVLQTQEQVCLIPEGLPAVLREDGEFLRIEITSGASELRVIGTYTGGSGNIYCPFSMIWVDGLSVMMIADSCSFDIQDTFRLDEIKAELYEYFVVPSLDNRYTEGLPYGLIVQDEIFQNTLRELQANLRLLRFLLPILMIFFGGLGFFTSYLAMRSRRKEFAVMRCLGLKRGRVFRLAFLEQLFLAVLGCCAGAALGTLVNGGLKQGAMLYSLGVTLFFLFGTAISVWSIASVNVMKLMKVED